MLAPLLAGTSLAVAEARAAPLPSAPVAPAAAEPFAHRDDAGQAWLDGTQGVGGSRWVANADAVVHAAIIGGQRVPVTVLGGPPATSTYVASPHAAWISYPFAEAMTRVEGWRRLSAQVEALALATPVSALMLISRLDRAAVVANYLVSTNLHPRWSADDIRVATRDLVAQFPARPLAMRSVCRAVDPGLADGLLAAGWILVPARRIYVVDPREPAVWRRNHLKVDRKLLNGADLELVGPDQVRDDELPALRAVFRQLFLGKHCALNPDYTPGFFSFCHERRFLDLHALRLDGRPVGVLGVLERHGWVTTPLIGYDTTLPQNLGIYRRLMALLYVEAQRRGCRLHLSSGAGTFKTARGGEPHLEYTALYALHLGPVQRSAVAGVAAFMDRAVPWALARAEQANEK